MTVKYAPDQIEPSGETIRLPVDDLKALNIYPSRERVKKAYEARAEVRDSSSGSTASPAPTALPPMPKD